MKLAQFKTNGSAEPRLGVLRGDAIADVTAIAPDMLALIRGGPEALEAVRRAPTAPLHSLEAVTFLPAVQAGKILAIGRNYVEHAREEGSELPKAPLVFNKLPSALSAHGAPIRIPPLSDQVDFEAELAVVIGRRASYVSEERAFDHVFGYAPINDVSARDLQFGDGQWMRGKSLDSFAPIGPFVTTRDEVEDPHTLRIEGILNGLVMQSSSTGRMLFRIPRLVAFISHGITLEPGDVIATGTPDGVGAFRFPPRFLKKGDVFEVAIERLGRLWNPVDVECAIR
jgi:2-keto-4-pentenoate hydratase/2-oxohepta-3-ene-1,7-dioic acid hydratase in catechol pathway